MLLKTNGDLNAYAICTLLCLVNTWICEPAKTLKWNQSPQKHLAFKNSKNGIP